MCYFLSVCFLNNNHTNGYEMICQCDFHFHFPKFVTLIIFLSTIGHLCIFFGEIPSQVLCLFLIGLFVFIITPWTLHEKKEQRPNNILILFILQSCQQSWWGLLPGTANSIQTFLIFTHKCWAECWVLEGTSKHKLWKITVAIWK